MTNGHDAITIVSGLPRSGTSMMMKMLEAGGLVPVVDGVRTADDDNPKGYYEFERVKKLPKKDYGWMPDAKGKVVKIISELLLHLPTDYKYKIVFQERALPEILASQKKMLVNRGQDPDAIPDQEISLLYMKHLTRVRKHLADNDCFDVHYLSYNDLVSDPKPLIAPLNDFLDGRLDTSKMAAVIDPSLYRQRKQKQ
jgi:hypothetical protein